MSNRPLREYSLRDWMCAFWLHIWADVVIDGMAFRQCTNCEKFKDEGDE
jgi:hypothetical protein